MPVEWGLGIGGKVIFKLTFFCPRELLESLLSKDTFTSAIVYPPLEAQPQLGKDVNIWGSKIQTVLEVEYIALFLFKEAKAS